MTQFNFLYLRDGIAGHGDDDLDLLGRAGGRAGQHEALHVGRTVGVHHAHGNRKLGGTFLEK